MSRDNSGKNYCDRCGDIFTNNNLIVDYVRVTIGVPIEYEQCCVACLGELAYCYAPISVGYVGKAMVAIV